MSESDLHDARTFTLPEIAEFAQIEYRTLHLWLRRGLLRPSLRVAHGSGHANLFDESDVLGARVIADLRRAGLGMPLLERAAEALHRDDLVLTGNEYLLINGKVEIVSAPAEVGPSLADATTTVVYNTAAAREALDKILEESE
jgi:DNA-binding transcriptional MerR regulator